MGRVLKLRPARTLADAADELGQVRARIAEAQAKLQPLLDAEDALKAELRDSGESGINGALFRVTVSRTTRESLNAKAIKAEMPAEWVARYSTAAPVVTVRCSALLARA